MKKSEIQIFLAHASEDKPAVLALHERLKQAGYKPWLDKKDLIPGQNWRDEIPKAIKASQIFLACLSAKSANKQGYIQRELRIALDTLGEMPQGTIFFIPMRLEECEIPDLRLAEVGELYQKHTAATGQLFTPEAIETAYDLTQGQPWLVNALAKEIVEKMVKDRSIPITKEHILTAKEILI